MLKNKLQYFPQYLYGIALGLALIRWPIINLNIGPELVTESHLKSIAFTGLQIHLSSLLAILAATLYLVKTKDYIKLNKIKYIILCLLIVPLYLSTIWSINKDSTFLFTTLYLIQLLIGLVFAKKENLYPVLAGFATLQLGHFIALPYSTPFNGLTSNSAVFAFSFGFLFSLYMMVYPLNFATITQLAILPIIGNSRTVIAATTITYFIWIFFALNITKTIPKFKLTSLVITILVAMILIQTNYEKLQSKLNINNNQFKTTKIVQVPTVVIKEIEIEPEKTIEIVTEKTIETGATIQIIEMVIIPAVNKTIEVIEIQEKEVQRFSAYNFSSGRLDAIEETLRLTKIHNPILGFGYHTLAGHILTVPAHNYLVVIYAELGIFAILHLLAISYLFIRAFTFILLFVGIVALAEIHTYMGPWDTPLIVTFVLAYSINLLGANKNVIR